MWMIPPLPHQRKKERSIDCHQAIQPYGIEVCHDKQTKKLTSGQMHVLHIDPLALQPPTTILASLSSNVLSHQIGFRSSCTIILAAEYVQTRAHLSYHAGEINDASPKIHGRMAKVALKAEEYSRSGTRKATTVRKLYVAVWSAGTNATRRLRHAKRTKERNRDRTWSSAGRCMTYAGDGRLDDQTTSSPDETRLDTSSLNTDERLCILKKLSNFCM